MGAAKNQVEVLEDPKLDVYPTLLLVDDHQVTASIEHAYYASVGFQVFLASSASDVQDIVRHHKIDLLLIDVGFLKNKGLSVVKNAKKVSCNDKMKALVSSVNGAPQIRLKALAGGADGFFTKPAPRPKVLKEIKKMTEQKTRDTERVKQNLKVRCTSEGKTTAARSLDLSGDGMHLAFVSETEPKPGLNAAIAIAVELDHSPKPVTFFGVVVRHTAQGFGVRFSEMSLTQQRILDKYLLKFSMELRASQFYL